MAVEPAEQRDSWHWASEIFTQDTKKKKKNFYGTRMFLSINVRYAPTISQLFHIICTSISLAGGGSEMFAHSC